MGKISLAVVLLSIAIFVSSLIFSYPSNAAQEMQFERINLENETLIYLPIIEKSFNCNQVSGILQEECEVLVTLYHSTNGPVWGSNWLTNNTPCSWNGIYCEDGHVISLLLGGENFIGILPTQIENLSRLRTLQIINSQLSGSLPAEIGNLEHLTGLILYDNQLNGSIPPEIGKLNNLWTLGLGGNEFTGQLPSELGNMVNLYTLQVQNNQLSGYIPDELGNLSNLASMYLNGNQFTGPLPQSLTSLNLTWFWFNDTYLCEPDNQVFQEWLNTISNLQRTNALCN